MAASPECLELQLDEAESYRYVVGGRVDVGGQLKASADLLHGLALDELLRSQRMYLHSRSGCSVT